MDIIKLANQLAEWGSGTINVRLDSGRYQVQVIMSGERGTTTYSGSGETIEAALEMAGLPIEDGTL